MDKTGAVTLRHDSRLHHIGMGARHRGRRVVMLVADLDIRVLDEDGELLRHLTLDPTRDYQRQETGRNVYGVSRHPSPMSRHITRRPRQDSNLRPAA